MQAKIKPLIEPANRKGWGSTLSIQPQVYLNKMGALGRNSLPFSTRYTMLNSGKFTAYLQSGLWAEAVNAAMLLKNNLITPNRTLSPFQQFFGKGKKSIQALMQKFGEICIITFKDNTHWAKLANQGTPRIWVGYDWVFNPKTKKNILTRDMTFLHNLYSEYSKVEKPAVLTVSYEGSDEEEELKTVPVIIINNNVNIVSNSNSNSSKEDFENNKENFFDEDI